LKKLAIPVFKKTFTNADDLAVAMEARCYSDNRTGYELSSGFGDWASLLVVFCLCAVVVYCL
jgi:energy-coupling factor transporter transmembrane protein EcfT